MRTLPARDAAALLGLVAELHELDEPLAFPPRLLASLNRLIPSDEVGYVDCDHAAKRRFLVWHRPDGDEGVVVEGDEYWDEPGRRELFLRVRDSYPVYAHRAASGDWMTPYKVSDFATLRELRQTPVYEAFMRGDADYGLDAGLTATPSRRRSFAFWRLKRDFDERDRLVLRLLQPHLAARAKAVVSAAEASESLAAVEEGRVGEANFVVLCSGKGVIEYASPVSRALLARYVGLENGTLPAGILARRELLFAGNGSQLHVRVARTGALHVLLLDEHDLRVEQLTTREREILDRVADGKQNDLIASELGIAPATVAKHLEHVYRKFGVPNRSAAAAVLKH